MFKIHEHTTNNKMRNEEPVHLSTYGDEMWVFLL